MYIQHGEKYKRIFVYWTVLNNVETFLVWSFLFLNKKEYEKFSGNYIKTRAGNNVKTWRSLFRYIKHDRAFDMLIQ